MKLTFDAITRLSRYTYPVALNRHQFGLLGINWPPKRGWIGRLIDKEITDDTYQLLVDLKGTRQKERAQILNDAAKIAGEVTSDSYSI